MMILLQILSRVIRYTQLQYQLVKLSFQFFVSNLSLNLLSLSHIQLGVRE